MNAHRRFCEEVTLKSLPRCVERIKCELENEPFCLWLSGGLGVGKTTCARALLRAFGLEENIVVTSPTYTYMNDYKIGTRWFAHLDFYRADADIALEDLGLIDARDFFGILIEWPDSIDDRATIPPTHTLKIAIRSDEKRLFTFLDCR